MRRKKTVLREVPIVSDRQGVLLAMHDESGHLQTKSTISFIKEHCKWPTLQQDVHA